MKRNGAEMKTFDHRGQSIRYLRSGHGEPMILLHNGGTSHSIWTDVLPALGGFELFALDLLGFGDSSKPERGYELASYVETLAAFIDDQRLAPVHLVGNCMGSAISLTFARQRPRDVRSLVLTNPLTDATFTAGQLGAMLRLRKDLPSVSAALFGAMSRVTLGARLGEWALRLQVGERGIARGVHRRSDLCACYARDEQSRSLLAVLDDIPRYAALDRFEPPTVFPPICTIWGLENRVLSPDAGRRLNETLRPDRQAWLDGCGHLPMLENPAEFARVVIGFLSSLRTTEARAS